MFKDESAIAIDIGSKCIKMVHGKKSSKGLSIINYGICNTPSNAFYDSNINDKRNLTKVMSELISLKNFKSSNAIIGVKGQDLIIRHIEMPVMSDKQLKQAVSLEIQQYLPMNPDEYVIDSKKISKVDNKEKKALNVLLVAAPKRKIDDHYSVVSKLELKVKAIDIFANSITKLFDSGEKKNYLNDTTDCIGMVDVGYESTTVILIENGKLFLEREFSNGLKKIDSMIAKVFPAGPEQIESIRKSNININSYEKGSPNDDPRIYYINNNARQIVDSLVDDIIKICDFYASNGFNKSVKRLYLYGGGAKLPGIADYIRSSTSIETKEIDSDLLSNINNTDQTMKDNIGLYLNCISLLLRME